jgi:hypothetical protein
MPHRPMWTGGGRRSCAASTSNTPSTVQANLGLDPPEDPDLAAADRWTWLIITAHTHCTWPDHWSPTYAAPGNAPQRCTSVAKQPTSGSVLTDPLLTRSLAPRLVQDHRPTKMALR